jgi:hypothetical protein
MTCVVHRTRAPDRAVILMVETATIVPTGDAQPAVAADAATLRQRD